MASVSPRTRLVRSPSTEGGSSQDSDTTAPMSKDEVGIAFAADGGQSRPYFKVSDYMRMDKILNYTSNKDNVYNVNNWPPAIHWGESDSMSQFVCHAGTSTPVMLFVLAEVNTWMYFNTKTGSPTDVITLHATPVKSGQADIAAEIVKNASTPPKDAGFKGGIVRFSRLVSSYTGIVPFKRIHDGRVKYDNLMPKLGYADIKRQDLVLVEANILRRRKTFKEGYGKDKDGKARNLYTAPWDETNWESSFQLVDLTLLVTAPDSYNDDEFGVVGMTNDSQMDKRAFEF